MIVRHTIEGELCTVNALPWPEFATKFERWMHHVERNEKGIIGLDVETTGIDDVLGPFEPGAKLRTIQLGSRRYAWVFDPTEPFWAPLITEALDRFRLVSHTNYDPLWCEREFGTHVDDRWIDTMPMACLLWPGHEPKDLKHLSTKLIDPLLVEAETALHERFREIAPKFPIANGQLRKPTGRALLKWGFTNIDIRDDVFLTYAGLDTIFVRRLLDVLSARIVAAQRLAPLSKREQRIQRVCTRVRIRGQRVDGDWAHDLLADVERDYSVADERLSEIFGFTPRSPRVGPWLEERGAQFDKRTPGGAPQLTMPSASSDGTLPQLAEHYADHPELGPVFADLLTLGTHKNMLTNLRIIVLAAEQDGYVHPQINTQAAHTGRMSITKPAMQTFKKRDPLFVEIDGLRYGRLRGCFIARDGYVLVGADYASQEIRIAAAFSRDPMLLKIIREGLNQHVVTAQMIFGSKYVDKKTVMNKISGKTFYDAAKTLDFAQQYGSGAARIGDTLGYKSRVVVDENGDARRRAHPAAYRMWEGWRHTYAGLVAWSEQLASKSVVINPWGRRIPADRGRGYANANYAIQSTGRDVLGDAIVALDEIGWGDYIWLPVHDELVLEVPEELADTAVDVLNDRMAHQIRDIPLPVEAKIIGTRWGVQDD